MKRNYRCYFYTSIVVLLLAVVSINLKAETRAGVSQKTDYPLKPLEFERDIAIFLGQMRTSHNDAKLTYLHPDTEDKLDFIVGKFGEIPFQTFLHGVYPIIEYQSPVSALVLFYSPWTDVVFLTEWQVYDAGLFVTDMEMLSADFLEYDGSEIALVDPLWMRIEGETPIDRLYAASENRTRLFDELWRPQFGAGNWRDALLSLNELDKIIKEQAVVALRIRNQYINLMDLLKSDYMEVLRKPAMKYMELLHEGIEGMFQILGDANETTDESTEILLNTSPDLWENASVVSLLKVQEGAFVFIVSPQLPKYFLSFYFEFTSPRKIEIKRADWCSFDSVN